ncbi:hypothetical protein HAX54_007962 [Datura stramonium]|uniref:Trichome birefringence-like C-terminal domain-containing protein n=1 Tax=Datura stramonium TaxID=4076 RepID=A0ABS8RV31_DATST|nr:hypothetical protein [Datura stramonium]
MGLAYRLFFSSFVQFSPVEVSDTGFVPEEHCCRRNPMINLGLPWDTSKPCHIGYWLTAFISTVTLSWAIFVFGQLEEEGEEVYHDKQYKSRRWYFPTHDLTLSVNITEVGFEYAYRKALNSTLKHITRSKHKASTFFRTTTPDHFENGEWNNGGYCNRTGPFKEGEIDIRDIDELLSLLRPDGHPGVYRQFQPFAGGNKHTKFKMIVCIGACLVNRLLE